MLTNDTPSTNLAVKDLERAKKFYEGTLGWKLVDQQADQVAVFEAGKSKIIAYVSDFAGTNKATAMTFSLGDRLDGEVDALVKKGVKFEHYDMPGMTRAGEIHSGWGMKSAWFKDPDGNIISLMDV
jgi:catechol 2,3-dioxygenase-like lactoylglutathione lyase family enzyme